LHHTQTFCAAAAAVAGYLQAFAERAAAVDTGSAPPPSPSFEKQKEQVAKCK
jgi:hypothetical protein